MTALFAIEWYAYPAWLLMGGGAAAALWAIRRAMTDLRASPRDPARAFALLTGFRRAMLGLCALALGVGWYWHMPTVIGLALIIAFEETLESSTMIAALKSDVSTRSSRPGDPIGPGPRSPVPG